MLAITAPDSYKQREYAIDAYFFVLKLWEISYQALNASVFFEKHQAEVESLGFSVADMESRR